MAPNVVLTAAHWCGTPLSARRSGPALPCALPARADRRCPARSFWDESSGKLAPALNNPEVIVGRYYRNDDSPGSVTAQTSECATCCGRTCSGALPLCPPAPCPPLALARTQDCVLPACAQLRRPSTPGSLSERTSPTTWPCCAWTARCRCPASSLATRTASAPLRQARRRRASPCCGVGPCPPHHPLALQARTPLSWAGAWSLWTWPPSCGRARCPLCPCSSAKRWVTPARLLPPARAASPWLLGKQIPRPMSSCQRL